MNLNPFKRRTRLEEVRSLLSSLMEERNLLEREDQIAAMSPCVGRFFTYKDSPSTPSTIYAPICLDTTRDPRLVGWKLSYRVVHGTHFYELETNTMMVNLAQTEFYRELSPELVRSILHGVIKDVEVLFP